MIDQNQRAQLLQLLQSPQWAIIDQFQQDLCDKIQYESKLQDTEWDTIKKLIGDEGQVAGIKRFIKELYKEASNV